MSYGDKTEYTSLGFHSRFLWRDAVEEGEGEGTVSEKEVCSVWERIHPGLLQQGGCKCEVIDMLGSLLHGQISKLLMVTYFERVTTERWKECSACRGHFLYY